MTKAIFSSGTRKLTLSGDMNRAGGKSDIPEYIEVFLAEADES